MKSAREPFVQKKYHPLPLPAVAQPEQGNNQREPQLPPFPRMS